MLHQENITEIQTLISRYSIAMISLKHLLFVLFPGDLYLLLQV